MDDIIIPDDISFCAGVDEAGRGPLAGSVVAAAVILDPVNPIAGLADSKKLSSLRRERLDIEIKEKALAWSIASANVEEIDTINILHASMLAMKRAVESLNILPDYVMIDGNRCPDLNCRMQAVVKGDQRVAAISAASILAKVSRDNDMLVLHQQYPEYGFDSHKGYPTKQHMQALSQYGVTPLHRRSYAPVRRVIESQGE